MEREETKLKQNFDKSVVYGSCWISEFHNGETKVYFRATVELVNPIPRREPHSDSNDG